MRTPPQRKQKRDLNALANIIYNAYPKQVDEVPSKQAVKKILSTGTANLAPVDFDFLLNAVREYAAAVKTWSQDKLMYVPKLVSWIMQGKFNDDRKEWLRNGAKTNKQPSGQFNTKHKPEPGKVYRGFKSESEEMDL